MSNLNLDGLERIKRNAQRIHGTRSVRLDELFPPDFMREHTKFASVDEMVEKSPFTVNSAEDFKAIPDDDWDEYVRKHTQFHSWQEMVNRAATANVTKELFL